MNKCNKILVVDDDPVYTYSMELFLKDLGQVVFTANTINKALLLFRRNLPEIVFIDYDFESNMTGLNLAAKIKKINESTSIGLISGFEFSKYYKKPDFSCINKVFKKPPNIDEVKSFIEGCPEKEYLGCSN